jgi:phage gpG-like protein
MTLRDLLNDLASMQGRAKDPSRILRHISDLMVASVDRNFEAEGRPRWKEVRPATRRRKTKAGKSKILMWSGALARSIVAQVNGNSVVLGSNWPYARIHQKGGVIQRGPGVIRARLRTDARGNLLNQQALLHGPSRMRNAGKMLVFGSRSHKRSLEAVFTHGAYTIHMPARPFLVFQPGEPEAYQQMVLTWVMTGGLP